MDFTFLDISNLIQRVIIENDKDETLKLLEGFPSYYASKGAGNDDLVLDIFVDFLTEDMSSFLLPRLLKFLLEEELKQSTRSTLLRESSIGVTLITKFWYNKEGRTFLQSMVGPLTNAIGKAPTSLEVDSTRAEKGVNVKANSAIILKEVSNFVNLLMDALENDSSFPPLFRLMMQFLDSLATIHYGDLGLSLIGGVLFLRLINPAIVLPHKHNLLPEDQLTIHGQRALLTISKILQRLANQEYFNEQLEPHMIFANRFIRKTLPQWTSSFHKFMTGGNKITASSSVSFDVIPDDLINKSNQDIHQTLVCPVAKSKQREVLTKLFHIEKETVDWKEKSIDNCIVKFKRFKGTSLVIAQAESVINASVQEATEQLAKITRSTSLVPGAIDSRVLKVYNDNLIGLYALYKTPAFLLNRDVVFLNYHETIPEDDFSIFCQVSIDDGELMKLLPDDIPKAQRAQFYSGHILRGTEDPNKSKLVTILHLDIGGNASLAPTFTLKKMIIHTITGWSNLLNSHFARRNSVV